MNKLLHLLSLYQKELGHTIRTPLAVISNELQFIELTSDASNVSKAKEKIGVIGDVLRESTESFADSEAAVSFDVQELFLAPGEGESFEISAPKTSLKQVFAAQAHILGTATETQPVKMVLSRTEREVRLVYELLHEIENSSCEYFYELQHYVSVTSKLKMLAVDIFLAACNIDFHVQSEGGKLTATYRF